MTRTSALKQQRFNIRLTSDAKERIERAASLEGKTASSFMLSCALAQALTITSLVPAGLIGRLAVSERSRGQGMGTLLVADAVKRSLAVREEMAIHALVDAKDERAERFYRRFGFQSFVGQSRRLVLPFASVACPGPYRRFRRKPPSTSMTWPAE